MRISEDQATDWVRRGARIRVNSGAVGCENIVMAEGKVISWCAAPSLTIEQADGTRTSWSADLPIVEVEWEKAAPYGIYSRWVKTGQTSSTVWTAIQEAYATGQAATATSPNIAEKQAEAIRAVGLCSQRADHHLMAQCGACSYTQLLHQAATSEELRYFCPASGDVESAAGSGFDTCCDRPDLHRVVTVVQEGVATAPKPSGGAS